jgi:hypothetical protein
MGSSGNDPRSIESVELYNEEVARPAGGRKLKAAESLKATNPEQMTPSLIKKSDHSRSMSAKELDRSPI